MQITQSIWFPTDAEMLDIFASQFVSQHFDDDRYVCIDRMVGHEKTRLWLFNSNGSGEQIEMMATTTDTTLEDLFEQERKLKEKYNGTYNSWMDDLHQR